MLKEKQVRNIQNGYLQKLWLISVFLFSDEETRMRNDILQEFKLFDNSRMFTNRLFSIMGPMRLNSLFSMLPAHTGSIVYDITICTVCYAVTGAILVYSQTHLRQELRNLLYSICTNLGIQSDEVCGGVIDMNMVI
jgi:hypothetical protein